MSKEFRCIFLNRRILFWGRIIYTAAIYSVLFFNIHFRLTLPSFHKSKVIFPFQVRFVFLCLLRVSYALIVSFFTLITLVEAFDYSFTHLRISVILSVLDSNVHSSVLFSSVHGENIILYFKSPSSRIRPKLLCKENWVNSFLYESKDTLACCFCRRWHLGRR